MHSDGDAGVGVVGAGFLEGDVGGALGEDLEVLAPELAADGGSPSTASSPCSPHGRLLQEGGGLPGIMRKKFRNGNQPY